MPATRKQSLKRAGAHYPPLGLRPLAVPFGTRFRLMITDVEPAHIGQVKAALEEFQGIEWGKCRYNPRFHRTLTLTGTLPVPCESAVHDYLGPFTHSVWSIAERLSAPKRSEVWLVLNPGMWTESCCRLTVAT